MAYNLFAAVNAKLHPTDGLPYQYPFEVPEHVRMFLGNLGLLRGVPIHYLIPDEKYLPKLVIDDIQNTGTTIEQGALKFFRLDTEWISCLMDGALSIGPDDNTIRELLLAKAMAGNYVAEVAYKEKKEAIKKQLAGNYSPEDFEKELNTRLETKGLEFDKDGNLQPTKAQDNWCYSGFLLRSKIIAAWVGVEVIAQGTNPTVKGANTKARTLQVVRFEQLADDTIFCLCEGIITQIEIKQPREALHFESTTINLRDYQKANSASGVVDIARLNGVLNPNTPATSKTFAPKMLAQPLDMTLAIATEYQKFKGDTQ